MAKKKEDGTEQRLRMVWSRLGGVQARPEKIQRPSYGFRGSARWERQFRRQDLVVVETGVSLFLDERFCRVDKVRRAKKDAEGAKKRNQAPSWKRCRECARKQGGGQMSKETRARARARRARARARTRTRTRTRTGDQSDRTIPAHDLSAAQVHKSDWPRLSGLTGPQLDCDLATGRRTEVRQRCRLEADWRQIGGRQTDRQTATETETGVAGTSLNQTD